VAEHQNKVVPYRGGERASGETDPDIEAAMRKHRRAKLRWDRWVPHWQDCYDYAIPYRSRFHVTPGAGAMEGDRRNDLLFDMTAPVSTQEFASRLQAGTVPPFARWTDLVAGSEVRPGVRPNLNRQLEEVTEYLFEVIRASNFEAQVHEAFLDLAIGTGTLMVEEGDAWNPIVFSAVPLTELQIDGDLRGDVGDHFRTEQVPASRLGERWPGLEPSARLRQLIADRPDDDVEVVHATCRRHDPSGERFEYVSWVCQTMDKLASGTYSGAGSNPFITFRWSKSAGEIYGRGPVMLALPSIKTANMTQRLILENAEMAIAGVYNMDDYDALDPNNIQLVPGMVIPRAPGSKGLEPVTSAHRFDVSSMILDKLQMSIRRALYDEMLGDPTGTPMSATEVRERMADMARRIGSPYVRLWVELVQPVIRRVIYLLKKQGRIEVPKVNGREIRIVSISPLARLQEQDAVRNTDIWLEGLANRFGPEMLPVVCKPEEVASFTANKLGVPATLVRTPEEAQAMIREMRSAMGAQQGQASDQAPLGRQPPGEAA
jgi:hypothetical protein